jgi:archaemetzincin
MKEMLFSNLVQALTACHRPAPTPSDGRSGHQAKRQSFADYRHSRPARQSERRHFVYLSHVGELSAVQQSIVSATADYLAAFLDLPVRPGVDFDPASLASRAVGRHPERGHSQLRTSYLLKEMLWLDRPDDALVTMAVTAWDLCSDDYPGGKWGSVFGEAVYGHAAVWSLRYLGDPSASDMAFRRCLRRSCAVAGHEALHVLGLDHCDDVPCNMRGAACLSGPLHLCPGCLRKLCWNRQLELLPYLRRLREVLIRLELSEAAERYQGMVELLQDGDFE